MAKTYDLTEGRITPIILRFFFPMFFTNMLQQFYTVADTAIVGKGLGDNALAAVGNTGSLTFLIIGFSMGLGNGFAVSIAQHFGAKRYDQLRKALASSVKLSLIISAIMTAVSLIFLRPLLLLLQTDPAILEDSMIYGSIIFGGLVTSIAYNLCGGTLRSLGDSKTPFVAIVISTFVNIFLNWFFIFVLHTGVAGAAVATIISQVMSTLICLLKLRKIEILHLSREDFKTDILMYAELFRNGLPMALMNSITAVGCMVVQYFINGLGVVYTSAFSACSKFVNMAMQPACTAGFALSSFTSQNFGAQKYTRIREGLHVCMGIAVTAYILLGSVMVFFPEQLASTMLNGEEQIAVAGYYLPVCGIMLIFVDLLFLFRSGCQGMGYPLVPMVSGIAEMVLRIAVIVALIPNLGFKATAFAEVTAWFGAFVLNFVSFQLHLQKHIRFEKAVEEKKQELDAKSKEPASAMQ